MRFPLKRRALAVGTADDNAAAQLINRNFASLDIGVNSMPGVRETPRAIREYRAVCL